MAIKYLDAKRLQGSSTALSSSTTTTAFVTGTEDQSAMNPEDSQEVRWGYRIDAGNPLIGGTITSVSFTLAKATSDTEGDLSVWVGASSTDSSLNTKIGTVNCSALSVHPSYNAHAFTGTGTKTDVAAGDFIFIQNDSNRPDEDGSNVNIKYTTAGGSSNYTYPSGFTTAKGDAGGSASYDGRAPPIQTGNTALPYTMTVIYYPQQDDKATLVTAAPKCADWDGSNDVVTG